MFPAINFDLMYEPAVYPCFGLVVIWLCVMRKASFSGWSIAFVGLIGTWLHEMSHYLVGLLLGAKPVSFSLWPKRVGNYWVLGSVGFTRLNILNSAPVAFAPLLLLALGVALFVHVLVPAFVAGDWMLWLATGYVVACCLYSGKPSRVDVEAGFLSAMMYLIVSGLIYSAISPDRL